MPKLTQVPAILLQEQPPIYSAIIPGRWLLNHSTPSWRIKNPARGFQRIVKSERANEMAIAVLNQGRAFPNSIVLATNHTNFPFDHCKLTLPSKSKFLIVDGQHRLWAQKFADQESKYSCVMHLGLSVVQMAQLFLEINDNQKRVPSSLRWDLVRLVRPDDDPNGIMASELVYELATNESSPLFQRIDLTGEQGEIELKQASIAPEIKSLLSTRKANFKELDFDRHFEYLTRFLAAIRAADPQGWKSGDTPLIKARVLRALLRTIPDFSTNLKQPPDQIQTSVYASYVAKIDRNSLAADQIRALQGSAGIIQIYNFLKSQMGF